MSQTEISENYNLHGNIRELPNITLRGKKWERPQHKKILQVRIMKRSVKHPSINQP